MDQMLRIWRIIMIIPILKNSKLNEKRVKEISKIVLTQYSKSV